MKQGSAMSATTEEHKSSEVTFKFFLPEHSDELYIYSNAQTMYSLLWELDQYCRSIIKYNEKDPISALDLAERIREIISYDINLDRVK